MFSDFFLKEDKRILCSIEVVCLKAPIALHSSLRQKASLPDLSGRGAMYTGGGHRRGCIWNSSKTISIEWIVCAQVLKDSFEPFIFCREKFSGMPPAFHKRSYGKLPKEMHLVPSRAHQHSYQCLWQVVFLLKPQLLEPCHYMKSSAFV